MKTFDEMKLWFKLNKDFVLTIVFGILAMVLIALVLKLGS